jgi:F-type H+-transporting ATPase subunit delta
MSGADLRARFETIVGESTDPAALGDSLLAIADVLAKRSTVRRALVDVGRSPESRDAFARQLFGGRVDDGALDVIAAAIAENWSRPSEFTQAIADLGIQANLASAQVSNQLSDVEDEVFRFGQTLRAEPALRSALIDQAAPRESKQQLVHRLLDGKARPATSRLVNYAVLDRSSGSLERELEHIVELAAARRKSRVAVVRVAVPLSQDHRERLQRALSSQAGMPVELNVVVDPSLVGGIRVEIGDDVVDGTMAARLDDARRQLATGHA